MASLPTLPALAGALVLALASAGTSGCASASLPTCDEGDCDVPDPITLDAPIVSCWIQEGRAELGELHCRFAPENAAPVRMAGTTLLVESGSGETSLALAEASSDLLVARLSKSDYPVRLSLRLEYGESQDAVVGIDTLRHNTQIFDLQSPQDATESSPAAVALPFSLWEIQLRNRYKRSVRLRFKHGLPFKPAGHIAEADIDCYNFGFATTTILAVPKDAELVEGALRVDDRVSAIDLEGPGIYEVDSSGVLSRVPQAPAREGQGTASCWVEESSGDLRLACAADAHPALAAVTVDMLGANGDVAVLPLGEGIVERALEPEAFPLELRVRTKLSDEIYGLSSFESEPHRQQLFIASPGSATAEAPSHASLPFEIWNLGLSVDPDLRAFDLELQPFVMELGSSWIERFAVLTFRRRTPRILPGESGEVLIAVSPGQREIPALSVVQTESGQRFESKLRLQNGNFRATSAGLEKTP